MQTLTREALIEAQGIDVIDREGEKIGAIEDVYYDGPSGRPEWIGIGTGLFGLKRRVVPVDGAQLEDGALRVPFTKEQVKDSPDVDDDEIEGETERQLYAHYGVTTSHGLAVDVRTEPRADGLPDTDEEAEREGEIGAGPGDIGLRPPRLDPDNGEERQTGMDEETRERLRTEEERLERTEGQARLRRWVP